MDIDVCHFLPRYGKGKTPCSRRAQFHHRSYRSRVVSRAEIPSFGKFCYSRPFGRPARSDWDVPVQVPRMNAADHGITPCVVSDELPSRGQDRCRRTTTDGRVTAPESCRIVVARHHGHSTQKSAATPDPGMYTLSIAETAVRILLRPTETSSRKTYSSVRKSDRSDSVRPVRNHEGCSFYNENDCTSLFLRLSPYLRRLPWL